MPLPYLRSSGLVVSRLELSMPEVRLVGRQARDVLPMRAMRQLGWETHLHLPVRGVRTLGIDWSASVKSPSRFRNPIIENNAAILDDAGLPMPPEPKGGAPDIERDILHTEK
jgi:hypothetical protein